MALPLTITLRQDELRLRNEINSLPEVRLAEDRSNTEDYETAERQLAEKKDRLAEIRLEIIEAYQAEDAVAQAAMSTNADTSGWTSEMREFHQLGQRTSMAAYMEAGIALRQLTAGTPEHEYNAHVFGNTWNVGEYPLEMLLGPGRILFAGGPPGRARFRAGRRTADGNNRRGRGGGQSDLR